MHIAEDMPSAPDGGCGGDLKHHQTLGSGQENAGSDQSCAAASTVHQALRLDSGPAATAPASHSCSSSEAEAGPGEVGCPDGRDGPVYHTVSGSQGRQASVRSQIPDVISPMHPAAGTAGQLPAGLPPGLLMQHQMAALAAAAAAAGGGLGAAYPGLSLQGMNVAAAAAAAAARGLHPGITAAQAILLQSQAAQQQQQVRAFGMHQNALAAAANAAQNAAIYQALNAATSRAMAEGQVGQTLINPNLLTGSAAGQHHLHTLAAAGLMNHFPHLAAAAAGQPSAMNHLLLAQLAAQHQSFTAAAQMHMALNSQAAALQAAGMHAAGVHRFSAADLMMLGAAGYDGAAAAGEMLRQQYSTEQTNSGAAGASRGRPGRDEHGEEVGTTGATCSQNRRRQQDWADDGGCDGTGSRGGDRNGHGGGPGPRSWPGPDGLSRMAHDAPHGPGGKRPGEREPRDGHGVKRVRRGGPSAPVLTRIAGGGPPREGGLPERRPGPHNRWDEAQARALHEAGQALRTEAVNHSALRNHTLHGVLPGQPPLAAAPHDMARSASKQHLEDGARSQQQQGAREAAMGHDLRAHEGLSSSDDDPQSATHRQTKGAAEAPGGEAMGAHREEGSERSTRLHPGLVQSIKRRPRSCRSARPTSQACLHAFLTELGLAERAHNRVQHSTPPPGEPVGQPVKQQSVSPTVVLHQPRRKGPPPPVVVVVNHPASSRPSGPPPPLGMSLAPGAGGATNVNGHMTMSVAAARAPYFKQEPFYGAGQPVVVMKQAQWEEDEDERGAAAVLGDMALGSAGPAAWRHPVKEEKGGAAMRMGVIGVAMGGGPVAGPGAGGKGGRRKATPMRAAD